MMFYLGIIFMKWGKYKIRRSEECCLMSQIDESAIYRTLVELEDIKEDKRMSM